LVGALALASVCTGSGYWLATRHQKADSVLVTVNAVPITQQDLNARLATNDGLTTMRTLVQEQLMLQFAKKMGVSPREAAVEARYNQLELSSGNPQLSPTAEKQIKMEIRLKMCQDAIVSKDVTVTQADIDKYYKDQTDPKNPDAQFYTPARMTIEFIITDTQSDIEKAMHELSINVPFDTVAGTYNVRQFGDANGSQVTIARGRSILSTYPDVEAQVFNLQIGQELGPVYAGNSWWIFHCLDKQPDSTEPIKKVAQQCYTGAQISKGLSANKASIESEFQKFQQGSKFQIFDQSYSAADPNQ
jgi:hypothetical protein